MKKTVLLLILAVFTQALVAQEVTVRGRVTYKADGSSLAAVTVVVVGTNAGVITGADGTYTIPAKTGDKLKFSFIGMAPVEVEVTSNVINVEMTDAVNDLNEVVVIGYGTQKKALITGANLNVKGDEIAKLNTSTAMEALQGIATGISVQRNSGAPGAGTKASIRGLGTIGNSAPLYIVDGVSVGNIDYLNASDIESIDVLKDAASSAIYGSRAANGVILVTTKKGIKGAAPLITYDFYYGLQNIYKKLPALNAQEYMYIMDEGRVNDGLAPTDWHMTLRNNSYMNSTFPGNLGTKLGDFVWQKLQSGWQGTDWVDEMSTKNAPVQSHSLNITGSGKDVVYALGISYFNQTGILAGDLIGAGYKRITARLNTEMTLIKGSNHDIVTIGENFTLTNSQNRSVGTGSIYWNDLHNALVTNPLLPAYWDQSPDPYKFSPTLEGVSLGQTNPLAWTYYRHNFQWGKGNNITGNAYINIEPIKNLKIRSSLGLSSWFGNSRSWSPTYYLATQFNNPTDATQMDMYEGVDYTLTNTVTYDFKINQHKFSVMAGTEMMDHILNANVGGWKANTIFEDPDHAYLDNGSPIESVSQINTWGKDWAAVGGGLLSYYGRLSYNFKEKYLFDATFRADGSSNFAKNKRWGYFPSVSAGWIFTEEDFAKSYSWLSFGKLRASWGQNGNQSIDNFIYTSNISYLPQGYYFGPDKLVSSPTAIPANVPNPDVTWETSQQLNIGLDSRFMNSKLGLSFDWYEKKTINWLVIAPSIGTAGADPPYINGGDIKNSGLEFTINWKDNIGDFNYGASFSGTANKNKVTRLANAEGIINGSGDVLSQGTASISRVQVGFPIGFFYGLKADGLLQNQADVDAYVTPEGKPYFADQRPGDVRFVDQNQDGIIDDKDKIMLGSPLPDFEMGLQLNADYKGFYVNATLTGKFGMQVMQSYRSFADNFTQNYTTQIFGRWHGEGTSDVIPRLSSSSSRNTNLISDIYMHNADYVRISNLVIGYKFDNAISKLKWMKGASVYVSVNNLYTFTKYDGMDPDVSYAPNPWASGIDLGLYPLPRTVMFGMSVSF
jgi:TonB-dependent starch-binding outer membrane protein SusC